MDGSERFGNECCSVAGASVGAQMTSGNSVLSTNGVPARSAGTRLEPKALRALFVLNGLRVGGSETKTVRVVNALQRHGVLAGIASLNEPGELAGAIDPGIPVWHLRRRGKFSVTAVRMLRRLIQEQQPDVVLSVNLYPALYVSLATIGLAVRPRTVGMMNTTAFSRQDAWRPSFYRPFLQRFDSIVYGCELQRTAWRAHFNSMSERSTVIYNGVDTEHFLPSSDEAQRAAYRRQLGIPPRAFVLGSVGRLAPEKNQAALIDAVAELRSRSFDAHLLLVGKGDMRVELERRAEERRIGLHVTFAGVLRDVRPALTAMDVFVLPSTHIETFSNAALEAMAMCKPVILSKIGGAAEMVSEGVSGYTLEVTDLPVELPSLLARLHDDAALRERLGQAARVRVIQRFSLGAMLERYASLIDSDLSLGLSLSGRS